MKRFKPFFVPLLLHILLVIAFPACSDTQQGYPIDGDDDAGEDAETEPTYHYDTLGNGSTDGNPAIVVVGFSSIAEEDAGFEYANIKVSVDGLFLPNVEDCSPEHGLLLQASAAPFRYSLLPPSDRLLKIFTPADTEYCAMNFRMRSDEDSAPFHLEAKIDDETDITIEIDLPDGLSFSPEGESFSWPADEVAHYAAALDLDGFLEAGLLDLLQKDNSGNYRIDSQNNTDFIGAMAERVVEHFILVHDLNENGRVDGNELNEENRVARGTLRPFDGPGDGDETCPLITVSPEEVQFSSPQLGTYEQYNVAILNDGDEDLIIYSAHIDSSGDFSGDFSLVSDDPVLPVTVSPGTYIQVPIVFAPSTPNSAEAELVIVSNACDDPVLSISLSAIAHNHPQICITPENLDFGNVELSNFSILSVQICNCPEVPDSVSVLEVSSIALAGGFSRHFTLEYEDGGDLSITPYDPILLNPDGACFSFNVRYMPQFPADELDPHVDWIVITSNDWDEEDRVKEVRIQGRASSNLLTVSPHPVNFGTTFVNDTEATCDTDADCPTGQECLADNHCYKTMEVAVYNWTAEEQHVTFLGLEVREDVGDTGCDEFKFVDGNNDPQPLGNGYIPFAVPPGQGNPGNFRMAYRPLDLGNDQCSLQLGSTLPGMQWQYFPIKGAGRTPNVCPTARIAGNNFGETLESPLENVLVNERLCFYGTNSRDEDGRIVEASWTLSEHPEGSQAAFFDIDASGLSVCIAFDLAGDYNVQLKVQDDDGCWSDPAEVAVHVIEAADIALQMSYFTGAACGEVGESLQDVTFRLTAPNGSSCSDAQFTAQGICVFSDGQGQVFRAADGENGPWRHLLDWRVLNAADGLYWLDITYENDCACYTAELIQPICVDRSDTEVLFQTFDIQNIDGVPLSSMEATLEETGAVIRLPMYKEDGVWIF